MVKNGKANGGAHDNGTGETLARIARLISGGNDSASDAEPVKSGVQDAAQEPQEADGRSPALSELASSSLLEALPAGLAVCLGNRLLNANSAFALAFGYHDAKELEIAGGTDALFVGTVEDLGQLLTQAEQTPTKKRQLKARTRSGRVVNMPVAVHPIASDTDEPARLIVLHPDPGFFAEDRDRYESPDTKVLPESQAESGNGDRPKKKKKAKKKKKGGGNDKKRASQAEQSSTSDFLAKVSHELRTPLNSIIGFAELMKDEQLGPIENERYRGYIRDILDSGIYALSLVNDLLDISKIKSGEFELNFTAVDMDEVISESVQSMQPQAQRRRVLLRSSFADDVPPVLADRRSIRQIVLNLVSNAIKFTMPGGQVIVSVLQTESGGVRMRVRDTGIGMSKSEVADAMKPFKQVDAAPRTQLGTGLGLPLTKALVEANRARFKVRSATGAGTRVDVTFPKDRVAEPRE